MLLTRPEEGAARTARLLEARGFIPVSAPMLSIRPRPVATIDASRSQAVLVTSGHALASLQPLARTGLPLFAVGDATARQAGSLGWPIVRSASGDAAALAGLCGALLSPSDGPLLLASGEGQGTALAAELRRRGFRVIRRVAYVQAPVRVFPPHAAAALLDGVFATLFLSRSAAASFAALLPPRLADTLCASVALGISGDAIGPVHRLPWRDVRVALHPTQEDVLALL